jgi:undecaprenyl-diphosphatase
MSAPLFQAAVLGFVQGATEFLPVSSTAHLVLVQRLFGLSSATYGLSFDLFTSLGTTIAVIWYFHRDLYRLLAHLFTPRSPEGQQARWILEVTLLVGLAGYFAEDWVASESLRSLPVIAWALLLFSLVMWLAERYTASLTTKRDLSLPSAYAVGLAQIIAFIPGISRSGASITAGLFAGLSREQAARFSFLLSVPVMLAAVSKRSLTMLRDGTPLASDTAWFYLTGFTVAALVGYASIHYLMQFIRRSTLHPFIVYRIALALLIFLVLGLGQ